MIKKSHIKWFITIFHTILLVTVLLLKIVTICYYCKNIVQNKKTCYHINIKWQKNNKLRRIDIKNRACYYFNNIISTKDIDFESCS